MEVEHLDAEQISLLEQLERLDLDEGGSPPPEDPWQLGVDEGPMRGDLRRQIAALERSLTRFVLANCPTEQVRTSQTRGPGLLSTSELEEIRDELLACRARLHDRVIQRTLGQDPDRPQAGQAARSGSPGSAGAPGGSQAGDATTSGDATSSGGRRGVRRLGRKPRGER